MAVVLPFVDPPSPSGLAARRLRNDRGDGPGGPGATLSQSRQSRSMVGSGGSAAMTMSNARQTYRAVPLAEKSYASRSRVSLILDPHHNSQFLKEQHLAFAPRHDSLLRKAIISFPCRSNPSIGARLNMSSRGAGDTLRTRS